MLLQEFQSGNYAPHDYDTTIKKIYMLHTIIYYIKTPFFSRNGYTIERSYVQYKARMGTILADGYIPLP